jgi:predicted transposase YbfD/YdcC
MNINYKSAIINRRPINPQIIKQLSKISFGQWPQSTKDNHPQRLKWIHEILTNCIRIAQSLEFYDHHPLILSLNSMMHRHSL